MIRNLKKAREERRSQLPHFDGRCWPQTCAPVWAIEPGPSVLKRRPTCYVRGRVVTPACIRLDALLMPPNRPLVPRQRAFRSRPAFLKQLKAG